MFYVSYSRDPNKRGDPNKRPGWKNGTCEQFGGVPTFSIHALTKSNLTSPSESVIPVIPHLNCSQVPLFHPGRLLGTPRLLGSLEQGIEEHSIQSLLDFF